ncbi:carbohydrate kinase family protein [Maritalea sp.]|uniref:carbohydrate kinase family protein n=1 Tax=Maritalea sp. TaxID=2003361 RepID=UPI0039E3340D
MSAAKSGKVLAVGRVYCDFVFSDFAHMPVLGEEVYADKFGVHAGGGAFITAAHLVGCGKHTALCAVLPAAPFDALIHDDIIAANIDVGPCVIASPEWGLQTTIAMAHDGDRAFLTRRGGFAVPAACQNEISSGEYRHLHIAELATLIECPQLLDWANQAHLTISLDCSWDEGAMHHRDAIKLISRVDVFLPNLAELQFIMRADAIVASDVSATFGESCLVVVKKSADGASLIQNGNQIHSPAIAGEVVDTTGAGDAFNAGFIAAWLNGNNSSDCLLAGNKRAAICVAGLGGASSKSGNGEQEFSQLKTTSM